MLKLCRLCNKQTLKYANLRDLDRSKRELEENTIIRKSLERNSLNRYREMNTLYKSSRDVSPEINESRDQQSIMVMSGKRIERLPHVIDDHLRNSNPHLEKFSSSHKIRKITLSGDINEKLVNRTLKRKVFKGNCRINNSSLRNLISKNDELTSGNNTLVQNKPEPIFSKIASGNSFNHNRESLEIDEKTNQLLHPRLNKVSFNNKEYDDNNGDFVSNMTMLKGSCISLAKSRPKKIQDRNLLSKSKKSSIPKFRKEMVLPIITNR